MAERLGANWGEVTPRSAWDELRAVSPMHAGMTNERLDQGDGLQWPCYDEDDPGTKFLHARLWEEDREKRGPKAPFSVTPFEPRYGLWATVARETLLGVNGKTPFGTAESVDIKTALRSYTDWASRQMFMEKSIGTIEPGKYADLAVWDKDLYSIPTAELKDMKCTMTIFDGKVIHD